MLIVRKEFERDRTYFCKKSSSTTAEMSRSGFPIPNKIPSDAIFVLFVGEMNRERGIQQLMRVERSGVLRCERKGGGVMELSKSDSGLLLGFIQWTSLCYLVPLLSISSYFGISSVFYPNIILVLEKLLSHKTRPDIRPCTRKKINKIFISSYQV
jgi:hypothetical protein